MDRQPTWEDFLDIRFEHHMRRAERSCTSNIGPYSAIPPPAESYLRQSGPNPTIVPRILDSFHSFLEEKGILDQPLPVGIVHNLGRLQQNLLTTIICIKVIFGPSEGTRTLERGRLTRAVHDQPLLLCVLSRALPRDDCRLLYRAIDEIPRRTIMEEMCSATMVRDVCLVL